MPSSIPQDQAGDGQVMSGPTKTRRTTTTTTPSSSVQFDILRLLLLLKVAAPACIVHVSVSLLGTLLAWS